MRGLSIVLLFAVAACTGPVGLTQSNLIQRRDPQNVYPANFRSDLLAFMQTYLNDPSHIRAASVTRPQLRRIARASGERYVACLQYNARNSDGRYAGLKETVAIFVSGKFDRFIDPQRGDLQRENAQLQVRELCKDAVYEPFRELQTLKR
jgi:hypothetical protein